MTRKRARKLLMAIGVSRNRASRVLRIKPKTKTNANVFNDVMLCRIYGKYLCERFGVSKHA